MAVGSSHAAASDQDTPLDGLSKVGKMPAAQHVVHTRARAAHIHVGQTNRQHIASKQARKRARAGVAPARMDCFFPRNFARRMASLTLHQSILFLLHLSNVDGKPVQRLVPMIGPGCFPIPEQLICFLNMPQTREINTAQFASSPRASAQLGVYTLQFYKYCVPDTQQNMLLRMICPKDRLEQSVPRTHVHDNANNI